MTLAKPGNCEKCGLTEQECRTANPTRAHRSFDRPHEFAAMTAETAAQRNAEHALRLEQLPKQKAAFRELRRLEEEWGAQD